MAIVVQKLRDRKPLDVGAGLAAARQPGVAPARFAAGFLADRPSPNRGGLGAVTGGSPAMWLA
jgi:hypothetical protein